MRTLILSAIKQIYKPLNRRYPQNYLIKHPWVGMLFLALFIFAFMVLYRPLNAHESGVLNYPTTMAVYSILAALSFLFIVKILKSIAFFSEAEDWTFFKELISITLILLGMAITIYFLGFAIEKPADRWNWETVLDSFQSVFLIGILPFSIFTITNYRYLTFQGNWVNEEMTLSESQSNSIEALINISSKLKKESLSFYPTQFIYAVSDGNYVDFYLKKDNEVIKATIRNSISTIEKQLSEIPHLVKTHRAFIVNLQKIQKKQGNALGYRLKLEGTDTEIPVSRQNTQIIDQKLKLLQQ
ncbi:LytTR family transcriptional regulator DNA-binding domain-containing protein [Sunxiuqinia sp. sy24]|uniref:LytTR family transcriptional regulator DNA-binding domain-containing protein n=1 Tax=Sunxiuqinia sp. sy24 TaxID=3461495 RepID=UPI004045CC71